MYKWILPFAKATITSHFGETENRVRPHRGTDFAPAIKSVIPAVTDGKITNIEKTVELGYVVELQANDGGIYFGYCHLFEKPKKLRVGDSVLCGQPIGRVGNTGTASKGAHLHLTASKEGRAYIAGKVFDAYKYLIKKGAK